MNPDPSNNLLRQRQNEYNERFNLNQFYNAVEDEQRYMNEYANLVHRYNDFITSGNAMFSRMEQTLRENLSRTIVRQNFYYNSRQVPYAAAAPAPAPAPAAPAPAAPAPAPLIGGDTLPRLLSRYLNNELPRGAREPNNHAEHNIFSMLYTVPIELGRNANGGGGGTAPTNEQIRRSTMNTVFGNILSPVNATCPISRDEFNDESEITMIRSCNHIFNRSSLREWFVNHSTCPMCRSDIREYAPATAAHLPERRRQQQPPPPPQQPPPPPANLSIDRIDDNEFTFSYDMPVGYNNDQIYQDIINTVNHMTNHRGYNNQRGSGGGGGGGDDDIMEVD